jgi:predicted KAP-like P-loop ATPase
MSGFIKDTKLIEEDFRVDDLLDFSNEVERLNKLIKNISTSGLIGYVGKFGSGKSTTIFQMQKKYSDDKTVKWFYFDAWKYPERKDLWEGFVLDIADQVEKRKQIQKKISGKETKSATVDIATDIAGAGFEFIKGLDVLKDIGNRISQAFGHIEGKLEIVDKLTEIFKKSPIKHVFELQILLKSLLSGLPQRDIFINFC